MTERICKWLQPTARRFESGPTFQDNIMTYEVEEFSGEEVLREEASLELRCLKRQLKIFNRRLSRIESVLQDILVYISEQEREDTAG